MLGRSDDTDSQMRSSANQFTDRIAWDISAASADELMAWEEASEALTYEADVLRLWASTPGGTQTYNYGNAIQRIMSCPGKEKASSPRHSLLCLCLSGVKVKRRPVPNRQRCRKKIP